MKGLIFPIYFFNILIILSQSCANERIHKLSESKCINCHEEVINRWEMNTSSHSIIFSCDFCHEQKRNRPGDGHMSSTECKTCHTEITHIPLIGMTEKLCTSCHEPHGTSNLYLIKERIELSQHHDIDIKFNSLEGKADWSFAELEENADGSNGMEPGTGLCEICHLTTIYYNSAGNGGPHFTQRCIDCHKHITGFLAGGE